MSAELRQRLITDPTAIHKQQKQSELSASSDHQPSLLPSPPSVTSLKRLATLTNLHHINSPPINLHHSPSSLFYFLCFSLILVIRLISAVFTPIQDCDETFNYWEPTHFLQYGYGHQTWEYSPVYALRSYSYLYIHVILIKLSNIMGISAIFNTGKVGEFFALRVCFALISALIEARFVYAIATRFRRSIAVVTLALLIGSAGMFHASTAYLPSSFTMYFIMLTWASWMMEQYGIAIFCMAVCGFIGWPFSVVLAIPLAIEIINKFKSQLLITPILWGIISTIICIIPSILIDYHYYHRWLLAVVNLAIYNSHHTGTGGANLYGVEPASYYVLNLLLNFNLITVLALIAPLLAISLYLFYRAEIDLLFLKWTAPLFIWLFCMFCMPHKEERFLFVIYPILAFAAAYALVYATLILRQWFCCIADRKSRKAKYQQIDEDDDGNHNGNTDHSIQSAVQLSRKIGYGSTTFVILIILIISLLSAARIAALILNYNAPLILYQHLSETAIYQYIPTLTPTSESHSESSSTSGGYTSITTTDSSGPLSICVGKEWYRFPSHYFIPSPVTIVKKQNTATTATIATTTAEARLRFLPSSFTGLLPGYYEESGFTPSAQSWSLADTLDDSRVSGTSMIPPNQNADNRAEPSRYVNIATCDFIIDLDLVDQQEQHSHQLKVTQADPQDTHCHIENSWEVIYEIPFLDSAASPSWARSLYVPFISQKYNKYRPYQLLQRKQQRRC